jgi:capsular polysaccharide biosynthesis protein
MSGLIAPPARPPSVDGRPRTPVGPLGAARRHWRLALIPIVVLAALALAISLLRTPTYTAESRLIVGRVDVTTQLIPGLVLATQSLASSYSRLIGATGVVDEVARKTGASASTVSSRLSASPIPESPIIRVEAHAPSPRSAVALANAGSTALIDYVGRINASGPGPQLLRQVRQASLALAGARRAVVTATAAEKARSTPATRRVAAEATANADAALLRFITLKNAYAQTQSSLASGADVRVIQPALGTRDDRASVLTRLLVLGIVAGLVLGIGLASLRARLETRWG